MKWLETSVDRMLCRATVSYAGAVFETSEANTDTAMQGYVLAASRVTREAMILLHWTHWTMVIRFGPAICAECRLAQGGSASVIGVTCDMRRPALSLMDADHCTD